NRYDQIIITIEKHTPRLKSKNGDLPDFYDTTIQIIHTPGNTIEYSNLFSLKEEVPFPGDLDMISTKSASINISYTLPVLLLVFCVASKLI
ncbi:MAG: hypothetical protein U9N38_02630, partial [Thermodesulfobacteriota bacterium]|nr:hypothetical protein [Thermodesulfobacteriota bacterium]